ncbi:beta-hexosaminidase, partial [Vibrio xuii]
MSFRVELAVLSEHKHYCRFGLTIHNLTEQDLANWQLQFITDRYIQPDSFSKGSIHQIGSFCTVTPDESVLKANQHYYCEFSIGNAPLRFYSDGLKDALILAEGKAITSPVILTPIALASPYKERTALPNVDASRLALIPKPNHTELRDGHFNISASSQITLQAALAEKAATWLQEELVNLFAFPSKAIGQSDILFRNNPT